MQDAIRARRAVSRAFVVIAAAVGSAMATASPFRAEAQTAPADSSCNDWLDRVYRLLGLSCEKLPFSVVRGANDVAMGTLLVELTPATGVERTLWECGACTSPVRFRGGIAVATPNGITWVDSTGPHPLLDAKNVVRLLGAAADGQGTLLVVVSGADGRLSIAIADSTRRELRPLADVPPGRALPPIIPDQVRADGAMIEAHPEAGHAPLVRHGTSAKESVSPALDRKADLFFRLDPIWLPGGKVSYVKKPL